MIKVKEIKCIEQRRSQGLNKLEPDAVSESDIAALRQKGKRQSGTFMRCIQSKIQENNLYGMGCASACFLLDVSFASKIEKIKR
jgi:hypothetical protein